MIIRPAVADDAPALDGICLRTGDAGGDATRLYADPHLLADVYVRPYLAFEPGLAFVLAGGPGDERADEPGGGVLGYVLGARDSAAFERRCEREWWPALRARHPRDAADRPPADAAVVRLLHDPHRAEPALLERYPSHLHVDLLPAAQGGGWGRRLLETLLAALADAGSPGVHLGVSRRNERAIGFYRRMGFTELDGDDGGFTMGRRLDG